MSAPVHASKISNTALLEQLIGVVLGLEKAGEHNASVIVENMAARFACMIDEMRRRNPEAVIDWIGVAESVKILRKRMVVQ